MPPCLRPVTQLIWRGSGTPRSRQPHDQAAPETAPAVAATQVGIRLPYIGVLPGNRAQFLLLLRSGFWFGADRLKQPTLIASNNQPDRLKRPRAAPLELHGGNRTASSQRLVRIAHRTSLTKVSASPAQAMRLASAPAATAGALHAGRPTANIITRTAAARTCKHNGAHN